nr:hypothetical protein CFP56_08237 [Quercus suber]
MWDDYPISLMGNNMDIPDLAVEILHQGTQRDLEKFFRVAWRIWYNRNQVLYEANGTSEAHIWGAAIHMIKDFKEANGIGVVVRDSDNRFVAAMSLPLQGRYSVEETEAAAVEQGCVLAKKLGLERVMIESDSVLTIQVVEANDVRGVVSHIVKGIVQSLCSF